MFAESLVRSGFDRAKAFFNRQRGFATYNPVPLRTSTDVLAYTESRMMGVVVSPDRKADSGHIYRISTERRKLVAFNGILESIPGYPKVIDLAAPAFKLGLTRDQVMEMHSKPKKKILSKMDERLVAPVVATEAQPDKIIKLDQRRNRQRWNPGRIAVMGGLAASLVLAVGIGKFSFWENTVKSPPVAQSTGVVTPIAIAAPTTEAAGSMAAVKVNIGGVEFDNNDKLGAALVGYHKPQIEAAAKTPIEAEQMIQKAQDLVNDDWNKGTLPQFAQHVAESILNQAFLQQPEVQPAQARKMVKLPRPEGLNDGEVLQSYLRSKGENNFDLWAPEAASIWGKIGEDMPEDEWLDRIGLIVRSHHESIKAIERMGFFEMDEANKDELLERLTAGDTAASKEILNRIGRGGIFNMDKYREVVKGASSGKNNFQDLVTLHEIFHITPPGALTVDENIDQNVNQNMVIKIVVPGITPFYAPADLK